MLSVVGIHVNIVDSDDGVTSGSIGVEVSVVLPVFICLLLLC